MGQNLIDRKKCSGSEEAVQNRLESIAQQWDLYGWNLDLEPQKVPGTAADAARFGGFDSLLALLEG